MPHRSQEIIDALGQNCPGFRGAVLATPDGLVMVASAALGGDLPAARAAGLLQQVDECLCALTARQQASELMLWTADGVWFVMRLIDDHVLLLSASQAQYAGAVRMAAQLAAQQFNAVLRS